MEKYSVTLLCTEIGLVLWMLSFLLMVLINWKYPMKKSFFDLKRMFVDLVMMIGIIFVLVIARQEHAFFRQFALVVLLFFVTNFLASGIAKLLLSRTKEFSSNKIRNR